MVKWTIPAKRDLRLIFDYIALDSKFYARKVAFEIIEKTENLKFFPEIGRVVPEIGDPRIREIIVYSYRLVYEISAKKIEILALIHAKRNFIYTDVILRP
ncbi:type II toxin-antitoxin system RelE/ParE family toxin [candidate division TA06 bacterium]|uniref:Type II toxin-antitoxin system RelE/ParE family toxin n=1 Tax=candidate division TA06 bacterium TaxID=2250710 RepID=A0A933MIM9_UNCT6|nr:type II toxin-antitoxin system RelE/ParE family toxin [candidate division TA06 bacterium]